MIVSVNKSDFADALAAASRAVPTRPTMPVLMGVLLEADGDGLRITGTDQETTVRAKIPAAVETGGKALIPGRLLANIAARLPNKPIRIESDAGSAIISAGRTRFEIPEIPIDNYPPLAATPEEVGSIDGDLLASMVKGVGVAAGTDVTLPMLTGIQIVAEDGLMTMAATDRFRLAVRRCDWEGGNFTVLAPAKPLAEALKYLTGETVTIGVDDGAMGLSVDNFSLTVRLLNADFPKWDRLIPNAAKTLVEVDKGDLSEAVQRAGLVAERGAQVRLHVTDEGVELTARGDNLGESSESVAAHVTGEGMLIAFNPDYLRDGMNSYPCETVTFALDSPSRPALVYPGSVPSVDELPAGDLHLLMPVRLPN